MLLLPGITGKLLFALDGKKQADGAHGYKEQQSDRHQRAQQMCMQLSQKLIIGPYADLCQEGFVGMFIHLKEKQHAADIDQRSRDKTVQKQSGQ